jgi:sulfotransferase
MNKTFYFLAGMPRSGSTLLSAILNQNSQIYVSERTDLLEMLYILDKEIPSFESFENQIQIDGYHNVLKSIGNSFYANKSQPIIIDNNRAWGTPYNFRLASLLNENIKIICPIRPVLEILTSFILLAQKNPDFNFIDKAMKQSNFYPYSYRSINDARCEWLMRPNGQIEMSLLAMMNFKNNPESYYFLEYNDFISKPKESIDNIYRFLDLDNYEHFYSDIKYINNKNDAQYYGIPDLHKVRKTIQKISIEPELILSKYIINKYKDYLSDFDFTNKGEK